MSRLIDLTMPIVEGMIMNHYNHPRAPLLWLNQRHDITQWDFVERWAAPDRPRLWRGLPAEAGEHGKGHGWQSEQVIVGTHMGAHMDAALHFDNNKEAQDAAQIPLESCYGNAILLDLRDVCTDNYGYTIDDLERAEKATGDRMKEGDIVIVHTGHAAKYAYGPNANMEKYHDGYPGMHHDTPIWFIEKGVKLVGTDTPNVDMDETLSGHINFLLGGWIGKPVIQIVENLANLEQIPTPRFTFIGFPLPIVGGSGSPVRAVALVS